MIAKELAIFGSHGMPAHAYGPMREMIRAGKLQPKRLVRQTVTLEQAPMGLKAMGSFRGVGVSVINHF